MSNEISLSEHIKALADAGKAVVVDKLEIDRYTCCTLSEGHVLDVSVSDNGKWLYVSGFAYENGDGFCCTETNFNTEKDIERIMSLRPATEEEITSHKNALATFEALVNEVEEAAKRATIKAKELGLDREVVVLSDEDELINWYSSRC